MASGLVEAQLGPTGGGHHGECGKSPVHSYPADTSANRAWLVAALGVQIGGLDVEAYIPAVPVPADGSKQHLGACRRDGCRRAPGRSRSSAGSPTGDGRRRPGCRSRLWPSCCAAGSCRGSVPCACALGSRPGGSCASRSSCPDRQQGRDRGRQRPPRTPALKPRPATPGQSPAWWQCRLGDDEHASRVLASLPSVEGVDQVKP